MVKVQQMDIPPEYQHLLDKILAWFDQQIYPTWATRNKQTTRSAKASNKEKTYLPKASEVWGGYDTATKALWKSAGVFMGLNGWLYFCQKFSYHKKNGLSLTLTPNQTVQIYGLKISNPTGSGQVRAVREDIVLTGQITVAFKYKKTEILPPSGQSFRFHADLYYFKDGQNLVESHDWVSPSGNVDWTTISESFGTTSRYYFHSVVTFYLDDYNADVFLDNLLISDMNGDVYREPWKVKAGIPWDYTVKARKQGWVFTPSYSFPSFEIVYIDD